MDRLLGERRWVLMKTEIATDCFSERYVVEIDGKMKSEHSVFVIALTATLQLKHEFPQSSVRLRDADEKAPAHAC
jgi:hypothetical protein